MTKPTRLAMELTDIILNKEPGWSVSLDNKLEESKQQIAKNIVGMITEFYRSDAFEEYLSEFYRLTYPDEIKAQREGFNHGVDFVLAFIINQTQKTIL